MQQQEDGQLHSAIAAGQAKLPELPDAHFELYPDPNAPKPNREVNAPYGILRSPKTQQMYTMAENPQFHHQEQQQSQYQFPPEQDHSQISLEQHRYLMRMNQNALR